MSNKIGIGVQATFDGSAVNAGVDAMQQKVNQANKTQYSPVSPKAVDNLKQVNAAFNQLMRIDGELRRRAKETGQLGASFDDFNWEKAYPNPASRARKADSAAAYVLNPGNLGGGPTPGGTPGPGGGGGGFGGMAANAAQAGLRAAGPAGGVAANAIGTGMTSGVGAGLMGLMGGMLALGVSKAVGAVADKVSEAEDNAIAYDRLKRVLGDTSVSFKGLQAAIEGSANTIGVTFDEAGKLSTQFTKSANLSGDDYKTLPDELKTGVGLSRAYGLDPSQGVGVMGQMRGMGVTKDTQEGRRFALLIGETIGKSGAFAKADEVMEAMASYATNQTRSSMGGANVEGFSGMLSGLVGSRIPGMDPTGAASLIGKINASLSAGGAKGEASQFFTNQVGAGMGLDPIQTQILREGGAFATNKNSFGKGSVYERYMGETGPDGDQTLLDGTMSQLRKQYGSNKGMLAQATANHLGVNVRQAMGLLSVEPEKMGEMQRYAGDLTKMSGTGIGNLSKALYGKAEDRQGLADNYLARRDADAISEDDRKSIEGAKGDDGKLREVLGRIASKYDQEVTQGSDIRDSRVATQNIATSIASNLIPLTQQIRHGVMHMAGAGKKGSDEIMRDVIRADSEDRQKTIKGRFSSKEGELRLKIHEAYGSPDAIGNRSTPMATQDEINKLEQSLADLLAEKNELLKRENVRRDKDLAEMEAAAQRRAVDGLSPAPAKTSGITTTGGFARFDRQAGDAGTSPTSDGVVMPRGMSALSADPAFLAKVAANEDEIGAPRGLLRAQLEQESRFHPNAVSPAGARGLGQIMPSTQRTLEKRMGRSLDAFNPDDSLLMQKEVMKENYAKFGNWDDATSAYNGGWSKGRWGNKETSEYTPAIRNRMNRYSRTEAAATPAPVGTDAPKGTPIPLPPTGAGAGRGSGSAYDSLRITADPIIVRHENERGEQIMPTQTIKTKVSAPVSFGAGT